MYISKHIYRLSVSRAHKPQLRAYRAYLFFCTQPVARSKPITSLFHFINVTIPNNCFSPKLPHYRTRLIPPFLLTMASILSRILRNPFAPPLPKGRDLQLRLDTARLYAILPSKARSRIGHTHDPCPEAQTIADHLSIPYLPSLATQASIVRAHLYATTITALRITHRALLNPHLVQRSLGFTTDVTQSTIPHAQRGLFIRGLAPAASLIALYPGETFLPSQLRILRAQHPDAVASILGDYSIARYDGVVVDGAADVTMDVASLLPSDTNLDELPTSMAHPFAHGHLVNHPPMGQIPNVLQFMLDVDLTKLPSPLAKLMPVRPSDIPIHKMDRVENNVVRQRVSGTELFTSHPGRRDVVRTLALIAMRDLEDEEVFMDYRFNPAVQAPEWYTPCEQGINSQRRWEGRTVLL